MGNKSFEEKAFLIAARKKTGTGATNAPVWILRKAGKRIWNKKGKRHWRQTAFGTLFKKKQKEQRKLRNYKYPKSGARKKSRIPKRAHRDSRDS